MKKLLKNYPQKRVSVFLNYLNQLKNEKDKYGQLKNTWVNSVTAQQFAAAFKKVASQGLWIDGDTITLNYRKKLVITYDYHAYMNRIAYLYPETKFDFGLVHQGDEFTLRKESGKVIYNHKIKNPFAKDSEIIGAYGVIKNSKGEFIETINLDDIAKMKAISMMKNIWEKWYDRMVLKSVIKRICSVHFKDEVKLIDEEDNEMNDLSKVNDISKELPELPKDKYKDAIKSLQNGITLQQIGKKYKLTEEVKEYLINEVNKSL